jgi:hypothetical protein
VTAPRVTARRTVVATTSIVRAVVAPSIVAFPSTVPPTTSTTIISTTSISIPTIGALSCHIFHREHGLIEFSSIGRFLGLLGLFDGFELNKGVVAFQINANELSERRKEHLQVFLASRFLVKVDDKECLGGRNVLATGIFLALDAAVAAGKLGSECPGDGGDFPVGRDDRGRTRKEEKGESVLGWVGVEEEGGRRKVDD